MAGFLSTVLLLTLNGLIFDCSEVIKKPSGPQMYEDLCHISSACFQNEVIPCHHIPTNRSVDKTTTKDSCIDRSININLLALMFGQQLCAGGTKETTETGDLPHLNSNIALHQACTEGRLCMVHFIRYQYLADINIRDHLGRTPVMTAALNGQVAVFDFLVGQGCDLSLVDDNSDNVLHVASEGGNTDIVTKLVDLDCDVEGRGRYGWTPVMRSVFHGNIDVFDVLVSKGCKLTIVDDYMNNILHVACMGGHLQMVKQIVNQQTFSVNVRGCFWRTPVMIAAYSGHQNVVDLLWNEGASLSVVDKHGNNILHAAAMGGHVHVVKQILQEISIDSPGYLGRTAVMSAACLGQERVVDFLVRKGCKQSVRDRERHTVLHVACMSGQVNVVQYILSQRMININCEDRLSMTPVMHAAYRGHKNVTSFLVGKGCKLSDLNERGNNILHYACMGGHVDVVKYIISLRKININLKGELGRNPLMFAVSSGHMNVICFLISKGCNLLDTDAKGNNILHVACLYGHVNVVKYILSLKKIDINSKGGLQMTPAICAAYSGHKNVISFLVTKGCKLLNTDEEGNNILHVACAGGHVDVVKYILSLRKLDINSRGFEGLTPMLTAASHGHKDVVILLVRKGCNLYAVNPQGNNVLHLACLDGHLDVVKYIISLKIDINSRGAFGWTPAIIAAYSGHKKVISYLISKGCKMMALAIDGNNILHVACINGQTKVVKYLMKLRFAAILKRGRNKLKQTPIMLAMAKGYRQIISLLKARN